jgi:hypothetical protein
VNDPQPVSPGLSIDSMGIAESDSWSGRALLSCLECLAGFAGRGVTVVGAEVTSETTFRVLYRKIVLDDPIDGVMGSTGDRDPELTLALMPHFVEIGELPLDPEQYGTDFAIVAVIEPFGSSQYSPPDASGVRWFQPLDPGC